MSIQQNIRFPEDLHAAISAEAERRGKPWTFSSVLIELAQRPDPSPWRPLDTDRVYNVMHNGLSAIVGPRDMSGNDPISEAYREGGGGYDGLQAVARWTLDAVDAIKASGALESMLGAARDGSKIATAEAVGSLPQASASTRTPNPPWHVCRDAQGALQVCVHGETEWQTLTDDEWHAAYPYATLPPFRPGDE